MSIRSPREMLELKVQDLRSRIDTQRQSRDWAGVRRTAGELLETERELERLPRETPPAGNVIGRRTVRG
jgi:hypothetical protein